MKPYYEQDGIVLYHGDCREVTEWLHADVIVTDPPYGIGWRRGENKARNSKRHEGIQGDEDTTVRDEMLAMALGKPAIVFGSFYAPPPRFVRQVLVWHKPNDAGVVGATTGYRRDAEPIYVIGAWPLRPVEWSSVIRSSAASIAHVVAETGHPHTKPVDLMMRLIELHNGSVADPCAGSGSTLVAAKRLGRKAVGVEVVEQNCEITAKRLSQSVLPMEFSA
jgi:hypothetical protein